MQANQRLFITKSLAKYQERLPTKKAGSYERAGYCLTQRKFLLANHLEEG
jgi:hypothetical protein